MKPSYAGADWLLASKLCVQLGFGACNACNLVRAVWCVQCMQLCISRKQCACHVAPFHCCETQLGSSLGVWSKHDTELFALLILFQNVEEDWPSKSHGQLEKHGQQNADSHQNGR